MKKLIWKELREQLPVTALGLLVFSVLLLMNFSSSREAVQRFVMSYGYGASDACQPLLSPDAFMAAGFFCAIFGAVLGFRQIFVERHPDLWAFLIHRPVTPMTILRSKVAGGALLYLAGAGLPLMGFVAACARPGSVAAPFDWAMALPLLGIWLSGLLFYAGGMLTALRKARWYASKACGLGLPLLTVFAVVALPEFWQVLILIVLAGVVQAVAVRGSFLTGGYETGQPLVAKGALVLTTVVSAALAIGFLIVTVLNLVMPERTYRFTQYQVIKDGSIVRVAHDGLGVAEIHDLEGKPVVDAANGRPTDWKQLQNRIAPALQANLTFPEKFEARFRSGYSRTDRYFRPLQAVDKVLWYQTADGKIRGFHGVSRRLVGELAPAPVPAGAAEGRQAGAKTEPFLPQAHFNGGFRADNNPIILATARAVFRIDLGKREVQPLLELPAGESVLGISWDQWYAPGTSNRVLVASMQNLRLMDHHGRVEFQVPYDLPARTYPNVSVFPLDGSAGHVVKFEPDYFENQISSGRLLTRIKRVNADGSIRDEMELPKLPENTMDEPGLKVIAVTFPPVATMLVKRGFGNEPVLASALTAIVFGLAGLILARRHRSPLAATMGWVIVHAAFGLSGVLAYLALHDRPVREACPGCGRRRMVNREECEHCAAVFRPPDRVGVEVFEAV